ncbi:elongator complex protein 3 [Alkaliphilus hydrothermalis]|uniref:Histone acetyltransferase (RNA polymerase elongator complex component) n=1 Tax=Alkaliphilus hydrothermalis TaxID=1482730 RepID=A0ABS2NL29_9FIRM|nr:radical SAM protein [Alkaliphilus hydrothermalis]MBM7613628.1 histone acetyltransferase (RNA polymerase elongator complex component) [Alkaliphilus hydrothermalis]
MAKNNYIIPIFIPHKGCPHDCVFCNQKRIAGNVLETTSEDVENTISEYLKTLPQGNHHREVAFYGGSFTGLSLDKQAELLAPAYSRIKTGEVKGIRLSTRPDYISDEILAFLKKYGVTTIELGVQSTHEEVLALSNRGHHKRHVDVAVELVKKFGFSLGLQMMVGLPGDSKERMGQTVKDFIGYQPNFVRIYPTIVIKDTALEELYETGQYIPFRMEECVELCKTALLSFQEYNIPVIRLGLQSTDEIAYGKSIVAGPYHPAFREMVETEIYRGLIEAELEKCGPTSIKAVTIYCNSREASKVAGFKQANKSYFMEKYRLDYIKIKACGEVEGGRVMVKVDK